MTEQWAPIEGFPMYSVSNLGQVRREPNGRPVRIHLNQQDVAYISLMGGRHGDEQYHRGLARLVAKAFLHQRNEAFDTPINLNGDRRDCSVGNLEWRPRWFAIQFHHQFKVRYEDPILAPIKDVDTDEVYSGSWEIVTTFGLLEKDVVLSVDNYTVTWPTNQRFQMVD